MIMRNPELFFFAPAYNEAENLKHFTTSWTELFRQNGINYRFVIIDDGSTDKTKQVLNKLKKTNPRIAIYRQPNAGHGAALLAGYRLGLESGAEYIFQTDSDGQTSPKDFQAFWRERKKYEAQFGVRKNRGDGILRTFFEKLFCVILRLIFGVVVPDSNAPFRLYQTTAVEKLFKIYPVSKATTPNIYLTTLFTLTRPEKVKYRPISFLARTAGRNKLNFKGLCALGGKSLKELLYLKAYLKKKRLKIKKPIEPFLFLLGILFLYIPVIIFLLTWINPKIAIPLVALFVLFFLDYVHTHTFRKLNWSGWLPTAFLVSVLIIIFACILAGIGGLVSQAGDHVKHNVILGVLTKNSWPVQLEFDGTGPGILVYYIGSYIIPAIFGKIFGLKVAMFVMLLGSVTGLILAILNIYAAMSKKRESDLIKITIFLLMFASFIYFTRIIYWDWTETDLTTVNVWLPQLRTEPTIEISGNFTLLAWRFTQYIPALLSTSLLLEKKEKPDYWLLLLAPLFLYSPFMAIGFGVIITVSFLQKLIHNFVATTKNFISFKNVISLFLILVLVAFLACNLLQEKPEQGIEMGLKILSPTLTDNMLGVFLTYYISFLPWIVLIWKTERKNIWLWSAMVLILLAPFIKIGRWNDSLLNMPVAAMQIIFILAMKFYIGQESRFVRTIVAVLFVVSGSYIPPALYHTLKRTNWGYASYSDYKIEFPETYFLNQSEPHVKYQYIDWTKNGMLEKIIIKNYMTSLRENM